jgi:hypothetical protein
MAPLAALKLAAMRLALGIRIQPPFGFTKEVDAPTADPAELQRLLEAWNPWPVTILGCGGFAVTLARMLLKPF